MDTNITTEEIIYDPVSWLELDSGGLEIHSDGSATTLEYDSEDYPDDSLFSGSIEDIVSNINYMHEHGWDYGWEPLSLPGGDFPGDIKGIISSFYGNNREMDQALRNYFSAPGKYVLVPVVVGVEDTWINDYEGYGEYELCGHILFRKVTEV